MFGSLAVSSERDHTLEITLAQVAGEPGLLGGLEVLLPVLITQTLAKVLVIKQVDGLAVVLRIITHPDDVDNSGDLNKLLLGRSPVLHLGHVEECEAPDYDNYDNSCNNNT